MKRKAFTLVELMIVVVIIGVLAGIISAKMGDAIEKSKAGRAKGQLANLRAAVNIYYSDNTGYPGDDLSSLSPKYMEAVPVLIIPGNPHGESAAVHTGTDSVSALNDSGGWAYVNAPGGSDWGGVFINCSHTGLEGKTWSSY